MNEIDLEAAKESIAYRSPIRLTKIVQSEKFLPINTTSQDDRVGCMVSGGIDSSLVLMWLTCTNKDIHAFTLEWNEGSVSEVDRAIQVVNVLNDHGNNIKHQIISMDVEDFISVYKEIPKVSLHARPSYFPVLQAAKKTGFRSLYSGEGGDEIYAGYIYKYTRMNRVKRLRSFRQLFRLGEFLPGKYKRYCWSRKNSGSWSQYEASRTLTTDIYLPKSFEPFEQEDWLISTMTLDYHVRLKHYLETLNRMAKGIEIKIVFPFMAHPFTPENWRNYWRQGECRKAPLVNELTKHDPRLAEIVTQYDQGFSPPPIKFLWERGLRDIVMDELEDCPIKFLLGKKLNKIIDSGENHASEGNLRALVEVYTITKHLRMNALFEGSL